MICITREPVEAATDGITITCNPVQCITIAIGIIRTIVVTSICQIYNRLALIQTDKMDRIKVLIGIDTVNTVRTITSKSAPHTQKPSIVTIRIVPIHTYTNVIIVSPSLTIPFESPTHSHPHKIHRKIPLQKQNCVIWLNGTSRFLLILLLLLEPSSTRTFCNIALLTNTTNTHTHTYTQPID